MKLVGLILIFLTSTSFAKDPISCYKKATDSFGARLSKPKAIKLCGGDADDPMKCFNTATDKFELSLNEDEALDLCGSKK